MNRYSVLMSVYKNDNPGFLKIALESIYDRQTRKPDEVIVVFDGPLNEPLYSVLEKFREGREDVIKYYPQEVNKGLGEALRIGSELCAGDYLLRMDSDDISDERRFEKQMAFVEAHPGIDVLGTDIAEFSRDPFFGISGKRVCPPDHDGIVKMCKRRDPMNHVTTCIKKSALMKAGGYKTLLFLEDYLLWINMIVAGCKLANLNESLVYVRIGNEFYSRRGAKERISGWSKLQDIMLENGMISMFESMLNTLYIRAFVNMPAFAKKNFYKALLRK